MQGGFQALGAEQGGGGVQQGERAEQAEDAEEDREALGYPAQEAVAPAAGPAYRAPVSFSAVPESAMALMLSTLGTPVSSRPSRLPPHGRTDGLR
ncbi:hypothetical protein GCM10010270_13490 [Streptomyces violaceus]|nr:hypothetical protein GCM10010270_13490 [Streptomyces janthinus]